MKPKILNKLQNKIKYLLHCAETVENAMAQERFNRWYKKNGYDR